MPTCQNRSFNQTSYHVKFGKRFSDTFDVQTIYDLVDNKTETQFVTKPPKNIQQNPATRQTPTRRGAEQMTGPALAVMDYVGRKSLCP